MNGYLSANASITVKGYKKTLPAHMPVGVFCDLSVIAAAPSRLSKSGLGDSLARPTAQADWLLSHLLLGTTYDDTPFALLRPIEAELFAVARGIALGDENSIALLIDTLLLSGLGMTIAHGSYPASQGEHMIAHAHGMLLGHVDTKTLHGEEIGVTTLYMARLQERLLHSRPALASGEFNEASMTALLGPDPAVEARQAFTAKMAAAAQAGLLPGALIPKWEMASERLQAVAMPSREILSVLEAAQAPVSAQALRWSSQDYEHAVRCARFLRDRFTFLDLE